MIDWPGQQIIADHAGTDFHASLAGGVMHRGDTGQRARLSVLPAFELRGANVARGTRKTGRQLDGGSCTAG
jgi:hypothetical protein